MTHTVTSSRAVTIPQRSCGVIGAAAILVGLMIQTSVLFRPARGTRAQHETVAEQASLGKAAASRETVGPTIGHGGSAPRAVAVPSAAFPLDLTRYFMGNGAALKEWCDLLRESRQTDFTAPHGLRIVADDAPEGFAGDVADALQAVIGDSGTVTRSRSGDGWSIGVRDNDGGSPDAVRNRERLKKAVNSPNVIWVRYARRKFLTVPGNSVSNTDPRGPMESADVYVDPGYSLLRPIVDPGNPEKEGPDQEVPFPAALWHEVMGHGNEFIHAGNGTHPLEDWNLQGRPRNGRSDGVIGIENEARKALGVPLRWYQYYHKPWVSESL